MLKNVGLNRGLPFENISCAVAGAFTI